MSIGTILKTMSDFISYEPVFIGEWIVKISKMQDQTQVFLYNNYSRESEIQWFDEEYDAILWIDYMCAKYI